MVGPITAKAEPDTLPLDLANIINSSRGHGFIIASFGSYAETIISNRTFDVMAAAFGKLKQKVIWKLKGYIPSLLGPNIKVMKWIPQNDLLAHKDIKAFVSHVGHSSLYESAYHGVPVVAVPLFADQFFNARKVEHFGLGMTVDHKTATAEEFAKTMEDVMTEPRIAGFSPTYSGSHYFTIKKVMEELSARGHEVVLVRPVLRDAPPSNEQKIPQRTFLTPYDEKDIENKVKTAMEGKLWKTINNLYEMQRVNCEYMLNDTVLLQELKSFDLIVYESISFCAVLVSELLGIPKVIIFSGPPNGPGTFAHNVPHPVSYIPAPMTLFTSEMTFLQRLMNFGAYNFIQSAEQVLIARYMGSLKEEYNITPGKSYQEAAGNAELVLFLADFALEYPQPLLPGQIMVGAISTKADPETLPPELKDFIDSAGGHGFVIASFGSYAQTIVAKEKIDVLAEAFGKVKQKVIWKLKGYIPSSLKQNIRVMSWIPQSDLLAHKDIKAFVSHVGHNSLYESAYHGVPVVAVPLCTDQFSNARKAEHFGLAKVLDHKTMNAEELSEAIQHVIDEPRFKRESKRISRLMKDNPRTPLEKAGDWIEYVHRHGGAQHLRAQVFNIPWYQYYLLDIIAFLVAIVTSVVMVIRYTCRCLCKACCKNGATKTKKE